MSPDPHEAWFIAKGLMVSLAVGLLIGFERGWRDRDRAEGKRVAELRAFTFVGLLGGVLALLVPAFGPWPLVGGIFGVAALACVGYRESVRTFADLSATSSVVLLLTLALGALAAHASPTLALSAAVVVAVLLDMKSTLHRWLVLIEHREMRAALQILVLSIVVLPNLPDAGYGPYSALNPYRLWWAVILVAGLSLAGHFAMRQAGVQRGLFGIGLLGGLASSTAATLALARFARGAASIERNGCCSRARRMRRDVLPDVGVRSRGCSASVAADRRFAADGGFRTAAGCVASVGATDRPKRSRKTGRCPR